MNNSEDKKIFDWMDQLDPEELEGVADIEPSEKLGADEAAWERIKKRTFAHLDQLDHANQQNSLVKSTPVKKLNRPFPARRWLAAACIAFLLISTIISSSEAVRAELKRVLQFIPGFGYVDQSDDAVQIAYVLKKPLDTVGKNGKVTVDAVLIQGDQAQISLSGDRANAVTIVSIFLNTQHGQYEFKQGMNSWGSSWDASYYYAGSIPLSGLENVTIQFGETELGPLQLTQAQKADDMLGLGPTDLQNGIQITGIMTPLEGNRRKVNLLAILPEGQTVESFGKESISKGTQLQITDEKGNPVQLLKEDIVFKSRPYDFLFEDTTGGMGHYQLTIPAIKIIDRAVPTKKVTLPIPAKGSQDIQVSLTLGGLPMDFTRVERMNARSVRFEVDLHYDITKPKTLQSYRLFTKVGRSLSYSSQVNESTRAIIMEWLDIEPGQKEITFYIGEPQIVIKGPWVLKNLQ